MPNRMMPNQVIIATGVTCVAHLVLEAYVCKVYWRCCEISLAGLQGCRVFEVAGLQGFVF